MGHRSTDKLVEALVVAGAPASLVEKARAEGFHDFKGKSATPIIDLVRACRAAGLEELAKRAMNGDFDATKAESDEWAESSDGQTTFRKLFNP